MLLLISVTGNLRRWFELVFDTIQARRQCSSQCYVRVGVGRTETVFDAL